MDEIDEDNAVDGTANIDFTYDGRNRLIEERRTGSHAYHMLYTYDMAGNRLSKTVMDMTDPENETVDYAVSYSYDVYNPGLYGSQANRLMSEERVDGDEVTLEKRWYEYDARGRVSLLIRRIKDDVDPNDGNKQFYRGTRFFYDTREQLWLSLSQRWKLTTGGETTDCTNLAAMEYRYDGGRKRYMVRPRSTSYPYAPISNNGGTWHDYDGDDIYGDYAVTMNGQTPTANEKFSHTPGMGMYDLVGEAVKYLHGNLIGTTESITDSTAAQSGRRVYTAFGEPVYENGTDTRYGYAGAWGYQEPSVSGDPLADLGWLHVGARYYDPSSGRFMQRDPIGIRGGMNAYVYVTNEPTVGIDPSGLMLLGGGCGLPSSPTIPPAATPPSGETITVTVGFPPSVSYTNTPQGFVDRAIQINLWLIDHFNRGLAVCGVPGAKGLGEPTK